MRMITIVSREFFMKSEFMHMIQGMNFWSWFIPWAWVIVPEDYEIEL